MSFPGNCYYNHDKKIMWLDIPKNASKSVSRHLWISKEWKSGNYIEDGIYDYKAYGVIREPISRWFASTVEIAYHHLQSRLFNYSVIEPWFKAHEYYVEFDRKRNLHHQRMDYFVSDKIKDMNWIAMDERFEDRICNALGIEKPLFRLNIAEENEHKLELRKHIEHLKNDETFMTKLKEYYKPDTEIFEKAKENE